MIAPLRLLPFVALLCSLPAVLAQPFSQQTSTVSSGGGASSGGTFTLQSSIGGTGSGISTAGVAENKAGYIAQIYDVETLQVTTADDPLNEAQTTQLTAQGVADDASLVNYDASEVTWSVVSGPVAGINTSGLATAGNVFEDTLATLRGVFGEISGDVSLTVANVGDDDFGLYAGDGLPDDYQVNFFGIDNPDAAPGLDPDNDRQTTGSEFVTGNSPVDATDLFTLKLVSVAGGTASFEISNVLPDRAYALKKRTSLQTLPAGASTVTTANPVSVALDFPIADTSADETAAFYNVDVTLLP